MKLTLVKSKVEAPGITSFWWKPDTPFSWKPGQYLYYTLKLPQQDSRGNVRHFTIASSPTEGFIQLTTKISQSVFKQTLNRLEPGAVVEVTGPRGDFVLPEDSTIPNVLLAGGIGITPFKSMIKYAADKKLSIPIHLIYSTSTPQELIFKNELDAWVKENPNLTLSYTITKPEETTTPWNGLIGRINAEMIKRIIENLKLKIENYIFWVCGPPAFVQGMQDELEKLKIAPERIELEQFTGY